MAASVIRTFSATTSYAALYDIKAQVVSINNTTGGTVTVRMASDGANEMVIPDGQAFRLCVVANAKEIELKAAGSVSVPIVIDN